MKPDEMKELAQLLQKVPGLRGIEFKEVKRLAELLQEAPEIGSIELKGLFGTGVVITRTGGGVPFAVPTSLPLPGMPPAGPAVGDGAEAVRVAPAPAPALKEIKSPMVGTFYAAPAPGGGAFLGGAGAGGRAVPEGRVPGFAGADRVHHRGDEDHERDRGGIRRRAAGSLCGGRPAG